MFLSLRPGRRSVPYPLFIQNNTKAVCFLARQKCIFVLERERKKPTTVAAVLSAIGTSLLHVKNDTS